MDVPSPRDVTPWLQAWSEGDQRALEQLAPLVYKELHRLAHRYRAREGPGHPLQATGQIRSRMNALAAENENARSALECGRERFSAKLPLFSPRAGSRGLACQQAGGRQSGSELPHSKAPAAQLNVGPSSARPRTNALRPYTVSL